MFCPRCGQSLLGEARFCSRCGLPLDAISEIVAANGLAQPEATPVRSRRSPRKEGMRLGGKLMFAGVALLPIFFGLCFVVDEGGPLLVPSAIFFAGLCWLLYSRLFGEEVALEARSRPNRPVQNSANGFMLLPDRMPLNSSAPKRINTPGSVTDHTTQFFD